MRNKIPNKDERRREDSPDNESCWWLLASLFMAAMMGLIMVSCDWDDSRLSLEAEEGLPATIQLEVTPDAATQAQTRADENAIKDIHVLVYNNKGALIGKSYSTSLKLTVKTRSGNGNKIYAIANTGSATLFDGIVATTEAGLKTMKTAALDSWDGLATATHLMMVGSKTGVSIKAGSSTLSGGISVERMVAKVTLNIGVKAGSGITIKDYQVFSLPKQSYYISNTTATAYMNGGLTTVNATTVGKAFLMYENLRGINNDIKVQKDKGESKAPKNSTYVVINGEANGYKATWRVYLGGNNTSDFNIKRNSQYTYNITLNRPGTDGADTRVNVEETFLSIVGGNSNCYMVKPGNAVTIPVERANESTIQLTESTLFGETYHQLRPSTVWTASLVWESSIGLVTLSETTGTGPTGRFKVVATNASTQGNAVVAIKSGGNILWSWHIWVTTYDGSTWFTNNNGNRVFTFMDRALGATSSTAGLLTSCGLMYQWGRKDPFPGIGQQGDSGSWTSIADNTDPIKVYNASKNPYAITKASVPNVTPNNLTITIRSPDTFYYNTNAPYDWFVYNSSLTQNKDLWSGGDITSGTAAAKSVFDPCPAGWRIPPWLNSVSPFANMDSGWKWDKYGQNWPRTGGYFPASGLRNSNSGGLSSVNTYGFYWSGSPYSTYSYYLGFTLTVVHLANHGYRAFGFPVRCSKDE